MEGRRSWKVEQLFVVFPCRIFGPYGSQAEKELTSDNNKNAIWTLRLSLLALIITMTKVSNLIGSQLP